MSAEAARVPGQVTVTADIIKDAQKNAKNIAGFSKEVTRYATQNITNLLDMVLFGAILLEASDVHLEPQEQGTRIRLRIDGLLQDAGSLDLETYQHVLSRIKLLSKIKLNITGKPQDGRFTVAYADTLIEVRTSSLPSEYGESIVMRILNPKNLMQLDALGLRKDLYEALSREIKRPNGMIAVTGPTGSGKTTTLYAFLLKVQNPEIKIITIEDPIEYHLKNISQTQVEPERGYSFSEGLMSIVRQDPDVILVGEIRDAETAKIALQASLTGHLVLSTIHANDAAGTIPRMVNLGADISSIASAVRLVVGQRLVRTVCKKCSTTRKPAPKELAEIKAGLKGLEKRVPLPNFTTLKIAKTSEKGCKACNFTGYKGRRGIFELFLINPAMEKLILQNPPVSEIRALAVKEGMITIYQSGLLEVTQGETTLEEVMRTAEPD